MQRAYDEPVATTAAEISRNFGQWQDRAIAGPVVVTHHGRPRVVIISAEQYAAWKGNGHVSNLNSEPIFETRLSAVLDHMRDGFLALDRALNVLTVNAAAESYFGVSRAKLEGVNFVARYPMLNGTVVLDRIKRVIRSGAPDNFDVSSSIFPGRHVNCRAFPYPSGVGLIFANLTEDALLRDQAHALAALSTAISASSRLCFVRLNQRGMIVDFSASFPDIVGIGAEELLSLRLSDLVLSRFQLELNRTAENLFQTGGSASIRSVLLCREQSEYDAEFSMAVVADGLGNDGIHVLITLNLDQRQGRP